MVELKPLSWNVSCFQGYFQRFAYTSPLSNKEIPDEILAYTKTNYFHMLRNPTETLSQIEKTQ